MVVIDKLRSALDAAQKNVPLGGMQQLPDYNELARRIEMSKQDLERANGRERAAYEAARTAAAATVECKQKLTHLIEQWSVISGELTTIVD